MNIVFHSRLCKFESNATSVCLTMWFSQSEVALLSNASIGRKIFITRPRTFFRMVVEYRPMSNIQSPSYHTIPTFNGSKEEGFGKHFGKRRK